MKSRIFAGLAIVFATAGCGFGEPNVYALSQAEAINRLLAVDVEPSGNGPFFMVDVQASRVGSDVVEWNATGLRTGKLCVLTVVPLEAERSRIDISCNAPGEGAATGLMNNMMRNRAIELIDATLEGRPFDPQLAQGSTASGWPEDVIDHGDFGDAVAKAREMERETHETIETMESDSGQPGGWGNSN